MIDLDTLRVLRGKLEQGLRECRAREAEAMEARLRQEGAVLAVDQLIAQAEQEREVEEATDGGNH